MVAALPFELETPSARQGRPRICLISPGHLSTNPRLLKEARTLSAANFDVTAVHGRYSPWGTRNDAELALPGVQLRPVLFGPSEAGAISYLRQTAARRTASLAFRCGISALKIAETGHSPVVNDLASAAAKLPAADLYVAHYVAALPAAARAAQRYGTRFAFDAEDFHPGDLPDLPENRLEKTLIQAIERHYLPLASYLTAASPGIADAYAEEYGIARPTVVLNTFPVERAPQRPTAGGSVQPGPSVYWFSQTVGPNRGIENAVRAIALAGSSPHLYLRGVPSQGFEAKLKAMAAELGVGKRIHLLGMAPPEEMEHLASGFDLGLASETGETKSRRIALTNKQFTYLLAGIPAVMSNIPSHSAFAAEAVGAAFLYRTEDPESLASVIDSLLLEPNRLANARRRAFELGQERFNWEYEQGKLLDCIRGALRTIKTPDGGQPAENSNCGA